MESVYHDHRAPGSFGGVERLRRYAGKRRKQVVDYLAGQDAYTFTNRFEDGLRVVERTRRVLQIDLVDLSNLSTYDDGYRYLLNCIDVFTKRAWSIPTKTKMGLEVSNAFERTLDQRSCNVVQSDKGTDFINSTFQSMLRRRGLVLHERKRRHKGCGCGEI